MKRLDIPKTPPQPDPVLLVFGTLAALAVAFAVQVGVWRARVPRSQTRALLLVFALVYAGALATFVSASAVYGIADLAFASLLFWSGSLCYTVLYTGIESDSPTLTTVLRIHDAGESGISHQDLGAFLASRSFVRARIRHLLDDGLIEETDGVIRATRAGATSIRPLELHRRLIGRRIRGG